MEESPSGRTVRKRAKVASKEVAQIQRVIVGILTYDKITDLNRNASSATNVCEDTLRQTSILEESMQKVYSQLQMVQQNCQEETTNSENPL